MINDEIDISKIGKKTTQRSFHRTGTTPNTAYNASKSAFL